MITVPAQALLIKLLSHLHRCGLLLGAVLCLVTACGQASLPAPSVVSVATPVPIPTLKPPDTDELVSGICAYPDTTEVLVSVNIDMPYPRCVNVQPNQYLSVTNRLSETVRVRLAGFDQQIAPNATATFAAPFGRYLAPGIHFVWMSSYATGNAVELWLTATRQYVLNK